MIVVSDTTPLRYLAVLGELELLPRLRTETNFRVADEIVDELRQQLHA